MKKYAMVVVMLLVIVAIQNWWPSTSKSNDEIWTNKLDYSFDFYSESLADYKVELTGPKNTAQALTGQLDGSGKGNAGVLLGNKVDSGDCVQRQGNHSQGICQDGLYSLKLLSVDAAGNYSPHYSKKIYRDTVAPNSPKVNAVFICGSQICADISFDDNTSVLVNSKNASKHAQGYVLRSSYNFATQYNFEIASLDKATNKSQAVTVAYTTPTLAIGDAAPFGELDSSKIIKSKLTVNLNSQSGEYTIVNYNIAAPVITYTSTKSNLVNYTYMVSNGKGADMDATVNSFGYSFNYAVKVCTALDQACIAKKIGAIDIGEYQSYLAQKCNGNQSCIQRDQKNFTVISRQLAVKIEHSALNVHINDNYLKRLWASNPDGRFAIEIDTTSEAQIGDEVSASSTIYGAFEMLGHQIDYRGVNKQQAMLQPGLSSKLNAGVYIPYARVNYPEPVGFPFRYFKLSDVNNVSQYKKYFGGDVGYAKICAKIQCGDYTSRGSIKITRGGSMNGHSATAMDFAPLEYNADMPTIVASTSEGRFIKDTNGYGGGRPILINGKWKCELKKHYNSIQATVNSPSGYVVWYLHLSPKTYDLYLWKGGDTQINRGDILGFVGNTGCSTGPHLHYEIVNAGINTAKFYATFTNDYGLDQLADEEIIPNRTNVELYEYRYYKKDDENYKINF